MTHLAEFVPDIGPVARVLCLGAAAVCAAAVNASLLGLFDQASAGPWVAATPQVLSALAACDALADRGARTSCTRELVTRLAAGQARGTVVANAR